MNNNNGPESGARPVLSFESRVACQPAEHTMEILRVGWSASAGELPLIGPGFSDRIVTGKLWQCGLLQQQA